MKFILTHLKFLFLGITSLAFISSCSYEKTTFDVGSLFDPTWDFSKTSELTFDENYVEIKDGKAQLKPLDLNHEGDDFNNGNHVGTSYLGKNLVFSDKTSSELDLRKILPSQAQNIVAYWKFENSTFEENGEFPFSTFGNTSFSTNSKVGKHSFESDGLGSYGSFSPNDQWPEGNSSLSIVFWYKIDVDSNAYFISYGENSGPGRRIEFFYHNPNLISIGVNGHRFDFPWNFDTGWHHIALLFPSGATLSDEWVLYVDGTEVSGGITAAGSARAMDIIASEGVIGSNISLGAAMKGQLDELAIYNSELTSANILKIYSSQALNYTSLSPSWTPKYNNIVGYWKMDGNWQDSSGKGNHGTPLDNATFTTESQVGSGLGQFDGSLDGLALNSLNTYDSSKLTVTGWFKFNELASVRGVSNVIWSNYFDNNNRLYFMQSSVTDRLTLYGVNAGVVVANTNTTNTLVKDKWYHVATTCSVLDNESKIYVDGTLAGAIGGCGNITIDNHFLGIQQTGFISHDGQLDDISIWNEVLTPSEINLIYNRQKQKYVGHYDSEVINIGETTSNWPDLSWLTSLPFGKELVGDFDNDGNPDSESSSDYSSLMGELGSGLISYWSMNEDILNNGPGMTDLTDISGNQLHCNIDNGSPIIHSEGALNHGVKFSPVDRFNCGNSSLFNLTTQLSVAGWVKLGPSASEQEILSKWDSSNFSYRIFVAISGNLIFRTSVDGTNIDSSFTSAFLVNDNLWHHFLVKYGGGKVKIYIDGVEKSSNDYIQPLFVGSEDILIGARAGGTVGLVGNLDELGIWSRALSDIEIQQLYRRGANRIKFQVKSCVDSSCKCKSLSTSPVGTALDCDGDTIVNALDFDDIHKAEFIGPGGDGTTYYSELFNRKATDLDFNCGINSSDSNSNVCVNDEITLNAGPKPTGPVIDYTNFPLSAKPIDNQYFQYRVYMEADENTACDGSPCLPELTSVNLNPSGTPKYYGSLQEVKPTNPIAYKTIASAKITADDCVTFQLSPNETDYYYWNSSSWIIATLPSQRSTKAEVQNNIATFSNQLGPGNLYLKAFLETNSNQTADCSIQDIDIVYSK